MRSVIIGGGVGGCALAAALRGCPLGGEVSILERRAVGAAAGMGFILMPNGVEALERIAPEIAWRGAGRRIDRVALRAACGRELSSHDIDAALCVSRERFLSLLRRAAGGARFVEGANVTGLQRADGGDFRGGDVRGGHFQGGDFRSVAYEVAGRAEVLHGDAFFGCDGAASRTRALVFPEAQLAEVVVKEIVSVAHAPALAARLGTTFHKFHDEEGGLAVGVLAESDERVVWFVQFDSRRWPGVAATAEAMAGFVEERLAGWSSEVREACGATDFGRSHLWPTRDLPPMATLACANLALVGDAAHACLPFTSQGANGALADAALLADLLREVDGPTALRTALARYSELRRPHHRRMFMEGRRLRAAFLAPMRHGAPVVPLVD
jgi:2-polyprenyl-6-methoxyphenol hydroxylase-like FAD-dependent oxidoreductase